MVEETLARIRLFYDVEERAKELTAPERHALRRLESRPIVDRLFARWQEVRPELRPTSKLAEAIGYALNRPVELQRFFDDGRIELDTGHLERRYVGRYSDGEIICSLAVSRVDGRRPRCIR